MKNPADNLGNMLCLDIYLSSLSKKEFQKVSARLELLKNKPHPLLSADIYCAHAQRLIEEAQKKSDLEVLDAFRKKLTWQTNVEQILSQNYYALVLTDAALIIQWANKQFKYMTGYTIKHAVGKSPKFLQGKNTSAESRQRVRQQLKSGLPFTETLINYRKNKEEYLCRVSIFPLVNDQNVVTHFLALESETDR